MLLAVLVILMAALTAGQHSIPARQQQYGSSDGEVIATIIWTRRPHVQAEAESIVEFRTKSGKLLTRMDYSSGDGEHGYGVTKARWTPDAQFFVYSLENSGEHSPWHSPVQVFSRTREFVFSLDDALNDAVMNPQFTVMPPDRVTVELWFSRKRVTVSLSSLKQRRQRR